MPAPLLGQRQAKPLFESPKIQKPHALMPKKQRLYGKTHKEKRQIDDQLEERHIFPDHIHIVGGGERRLELVVLGARGSGAEVEHLRRRLIGIAVSRSSR